MYCQECGTKYDNENAKFCSTCGTKNNNGKTYCSECGTLKTYDTQDVCLNCGKEFTKTIEPSNGFSNIGEKVNKVIVSFEKSRESGESNDRVSKKTKLIYIILWIFLGGLGVHRFYVDNTKGGFWMLGLTLAGFVTFGITNIIVAVMAIIDLIQLVCNDVLDGEGKAVERWT